MKFKRLLRVLVALTIFLSYSFNNGNTIAKESSYQYDNYGKKFLCGSSNKSMNCSDDLYIQDYYDVSDNNTNALSVSNFELERKIDSIDKIYGSSIDDNILKKIAKIEIAKELRINIKSFSTISEINIINELPVFDENDRQVAIGYNFDSIEGEFGYVILSKHTKARLVRAFQAIIKRYIQMCSMLQLNMDIL